MPKYLVNLTESHFSADDNRIFVKRGQYAPITASEAEHDDVIFAIRRGWVEVTDKEPSNKPDTQPEPIKFAEPFEESVIDPSELPGNKEAAAATVKTRKGK